MGDEIKSTLEIVLEKVEKIGKASKEELEALRIQIEKKHEMDKKEKREKKGNKIICIIVVKKIMSHLNLNLADLFIVKIVIKK